MKGAAGAGAAGPTAGAAELAGTVLGAPLDSHAKNAVAITARAARPPRKADQNGWRRAQPGRLPPGNPGGEVVFVVFMSSAPLFSTCWARFGSGEPRGAHTHQRHVRPT